MKNPLFILLFIISAISCSTIPDFRPSKPIEKASSFEEAINLCNEYKINKPNDQQASGADIVPWTRCLEIPIHKYPDATNHECIVILYKELSQIQGSFDVKNRTQSTVLINNWNEFNLAMDLVLKNLNQTQDKNRFSELSFEIIKRQLPEYSSFLEQTLKFENKNNEIDNNIIQREKFRPPLMHKLSMNEKKYCKRYLAWTEDKNNLDKTQAYFNKISSEKSGTIEFQKLKKSISINQKNLSDELEVLNKELVQIKNTQPNFIKEYCLDKGYWLNRPDPFNKMNQND